MSISVSGKSDCAEFKTLAATSSLLMTGAVTCLRVISDLTVHGRCDPAHDLFEALMHKFADFRFEGADRATEFGGLRE